MAVLLALLGAAPLPAQPDGDRQAARRALREGNRLFDEGQYEAALACYQDAYARVPAPKLLFNIGQAYRNLRRDGEALAAYERFLAEDRAAAPELRREADGHAEALRRALAAAAERPPETRGEEVPAVAPVATVSITAPVAARPVPPQAAAVARSSLPHARGRPHAGLHTATWIAGGASALMLGTAAAMHVAAAGNLSSFNTQCWLDRGTGQPLGPTGCADYYQSWRSERRIAIIGYTVGGLAAAATAVLALLSYQSRGEPTGRLGVAFDGGGVAASWASSF